jgi:hypothetical protein
VELVVGAACLLLVALVALVVVATVLQQRTRRQRMETLASYAAARGWRYNPVGTGLESRFRGAPFGRGHRRTASNVVEGWHEGWAFVAFDYRYLTSDGEHDQAHDVSVVSVHLGALAQPVPLLEVAPQGALGRFFRGLVGGADLPLGDPVFDERFRVRAASPELAHDVLHPDMRAMLAAYQDRAWRMEGDSLLLFRSGRHSPAEVDAVLACALAILTRVPQATWVRLRGAQKD